MQIKQPVLHMRNDKLIRFSVAASVSLSGINSIKFFLPALSTWFIIAGLLSIAILVRIPEFFKRIQNVDFRIFCPWLVFVFSILLSALCSPDTVDLVFSVVTIVKFTVIAAILALLISMPLSIKSLESFFTLSMMICAAGFAIAMLNGDWLMWDVYGDGRLGWACAWIGVFWKVGAYALPFYVYRVLKNPSWFELPALTLAVTIIALDGSRTDLLVVVATMLLAAIYVKIFERNARFTFFAAICAASAGMAYVLIQPAILLTIELGGFCILVGFSGFFLLLAAACFQFRDRQHMSAKLMGASLLILAGVFCIKLYVQTTANSAGHIERAVNAVNILALERIGHGDPTRMHMLLHGIQSAITNFPMGGGLGSTTTAVSVEHNIHIHMTYLQLLSDVGMNGLLSYVSIFILGMVWFFRLTKDIRTPVFPIFAIVCIYLLQGLFAPLSNEITDWFPVILALSVLYNLAHSSAEDLQNLRTMS